MARPTKYDAEKHPELARKLCLLGATDAEMADVMEISERTLDGWKKKHPEFLRSITRGKAIADADVASRLYDRAMGYSHDAVKIFMPSGADEAVYAPYTEHYPPDTQAASLWLRNRRPKQWRDKTEQHHTGEVSLIDFLREGSEPSSE